MPERRPWFLAPKIYAETLLGMLAAFQSRRKSTGFIPHGYRITEPAERPVGLAKHRYGQPPSDPRGKAHRRAVRRIAHESRRRQRRRAA